MEKSRKTSVGTSSTSTVPSDLIFGKPSSSSGLFNSVFPPIPKVAGKNTSSSSEIFGPSKKQPCLGNNTTAGVVSQESSGKGHSSTSKSTNSTNQNGQTDHCILGSSLYYGGQDLCAYPPGSHTYTPTNKDGGSSRGDWWEGSLYY